MTISATKSMLSLAALVAMLAALAAAPAAALSPRVWVAYYGVDSATCGAITAPCLTLQRAHDNVVPGGDISVLTPMEFGNAAINTLTISKSVNVTNDGVGEAAIVGSTGILVFAGVGDVVSVRGFVMDGQGGLTSSGIEIHKASAVHIQNCVARNFEGFPNGWGIFVGPANGTNMQVFVSDTLVYNNGTATGTGGIVIQPIGTNNTARVVLDRVRLENNVVGLRLDGTQATASGTHVIIRDSVVSGNAVDGILALTTAGKAPAFIVVDRTSVVDNAGTGIHADGPRATMVLNDNVISRNGTGISALNGGQLISFGNNKNFNNIGPEGAPTGFFSPM